MGRVKRIPPAVALAVAGVIVLLVALLTAAPPGVTMRSAPKPEGPIELAKGQQCFPVAVLPNDTRYVRFQAPPGAGLPTSVQVSATGVAPITSGPAVRRGPEAAYVEYRLARPTVGEHGGAQVCATVGRGGATVLGQVKDPAIALLGDPHGNWLAAVPALAERAGFGRGTLLGRAALWIALLLLAVAWILAVRLASGPGRSSEPISRGTVIRVGVVGLLFSAAFALTTPPFEAPDEMAHLGYVQLLADTHALPRTTEARGDINSPQGQLALNAVAVGRVAFTPERRQPWSQTEDRALDAQLKALPSGGEMDSFNNSSAQPPAYYAIVAVVQKVTGGSILDRLLVGRLVSALLFGIAAAGAAAFARDAVPRARGLAVAGGLLAATLPIIGFIGGSINPDALVAAVSAWTLVLMARILRQGPTVRRGLVLGALVGLGLVTKIIFAALLPAVGLTALVVLFRGVRGGEARAAVTSVAAALGALAVLASPYLGWAILSGRGLTFAPPGGPPAPIQAWRETVVYTFELFAGQFGPIQDRIPGSGPWDIWLSGLTGRMGWVDYGPPVNWVHALAAFWGALALLALLGLVRSARARRAIPVDAVIYAVAVGSLALMIARAGLNARLGGATGFEQARYLFPLIAIGAGGVALGLRQLPKVAIRNWAAAAVVVIGLLDGTALYFMTVGRYFA